jgi:hypothetical protein
MQAHIALFLHVDLCLFYYPPPPPSPFPLSSPPPLNPFGAGGAVHEAQGSLGC